MGFFSDDSPEAKAHDEVYNKGSFIHDALAGAVAYEATKKYNEHRAKNGNVDSHAQAKQFLASAAAAAITHLAETKGKDAYDSYKQKKHLEEATKLAQEAVTEDNYKH